MAGPDAPDEPAEPTEEPSRLPQDPIVARVRPSPSEAPEQTRTLTGFLGDSDRPGRRRLYFSRALDHYAEFRVEDVLHVGAIAADAPPFLGEKATRVTLRRSAAVDYTRTQRGGGDPFELDVRFGKRAAPADDTGDPSAPHGCISQSCLEGCPPPPVDKLPPPVVTFNATACVHSGCVPVD